MASDASSLEQVMQEMQQFRQRFDSILLATVDAEGIPEASYAPALWQDECYWIFISELARHTQNLQHNPRVSVLLIADESESRQIFARPRLSLQCDAKRISPESDEYPPRLDQMQQKFGNMLGMLRTLPDFHLVKLIPLRGHYVRGFGQAFSFSGCGKTQIEWLSADNLKRR